MTEIQDSARRWSGFVCPDCRFVFRVARDHDGRGLVCPSCNRLLRIPGKDDDLPPLLADQFDPNDERRLQLTGASSDKGAKNVRRKRKRRKRGAESPDWEMQPRSSSRGRSQQRGHYVLLAFGLLLLGGALGLVVFTSRDDPGPAGQFDEIAGLEEIEDARVDVVETERQADPSGDGEMTAFLLSAAPVVRGFLTATTVEELLKYVDRPEQVAERIQPDHPDGSVQPPGLSDYSQFSHVIRDGPYRLVPLRTGGGQIRTITLIETPDGIKVNWESWAGWSAIPPSEFAREKPSGAHVFRVQIENVDYYNFDFADERKWQSTRLIFPDQETTLYGYFERGTETFARIAAMFSNGGTNAMLEIRFPEVDQVRDQVEIIRFVAEGWLEPQTSDGP